MQLLEYAALQNCTFDNISVEIMSSYGVAFEDIANLTILEKNNLKYYKDLYRPVTVLKIIGCGLLVLFMLKVLFGYLIKPNKPRIHNVNNETLELRDSNT